MVVVVLGLLFLEMIQTEYLFSTSECTGNHPFPCHVWPFTAHSQEIWKTDLHASGCVFVCFSLCMETRSKCKSQ